MSSEIAVDISDYNINSFVRQGGEVFPYRFYAAFNSLYWEEKDLENPCPKCGNKDVTHLGSFLSSNIWYNVFACERCEIAWCVWDQTGEVTKKPKAVRDLVKALYDPDFTPDNEKEDRCENCALFRSEEMIGGQCLCEAGWVTFLSNSPCGEFVPKEKENRKVAGKKEVDSDAE